MIEELVLNSRELLRRNGPNHVRIPESGVGAGHRWVRGIGSYVVNIFEMMTNLERHLGEATYDELMENVGGSASNEDALARAVGEGLIEGHDVEAKFTLTVKGSAFLAAWNLGRTYEAWEYIADQFGYVYPEQLG